jgi:hypothetical protein
MSTCADSAALRAHLDHPDRALEAHFDDCPPCAGLLRAVAADAGTAGRALRLLDEGAVAATADAAARVEVALARAAAVRQPAAPPPAPAPRAWLRPLAAAAAVVGVALVAVVTPGGQHAVAQLLDAFRSERLAVVELDVDEPDLEALAALGTVDVGDLGEPRPVDDVAAGEALAGITAPALPSTPDEVLASPPGEARLTLRATATNGVPAELDGASLVVSVPGAVGALYTDEVGNPHRVIGRSGVLQVTAEGAALEDLRAFLLGRDELPASLRQQLEGLADWRHTLPIPVPADGPAWQTVDVGGREGVAFGDESGLGAAVVWQDGSGITGVAGAMPVSEALALAASL